MTTSEKETNRHFKYLSKVLQSIADGVILTDSDGIIEEANESMTRISGYTQEDLIGFSTDNIFQIYKKTPDESVNSILEMTIDKGDILCPTEYILLAKDDSEKIISITSSIMKDATGKREGMVITIRDITSQRKLQEQLVQADKMASIGQLAAGVAHEINNPIAFVMSNINSLSAYIATFKQVIKEYENLAGTVKDLEDDKVKQSLEGIQAVRTKKKFDYIQEDMENLLAESADGMNRVKEIVQNLKSFARLDEAEFKKTDINECIEITLKVIWNELKYKCTINKKLGKLPPIPCNPGQLNQVFMNLLENAAHAIKEHGDINIETEATETHIRIGISDTGVGISREIIEKLFDPFFTTKPVGSGTGLGLSISYGIIEKHNGTIEVQSEVGRGTKFIISLPINNTNNDDKGTI